MLRLAIADNPAFALSPLEVERQGPSYTAVTLEEIAAQEPGAEIFFILGRDALADLPYWHRPGRILELATLAVAGREEVAAAPARPEGLAARLEPRPVAVDMPLLEVSATDVRERVRRGVSIRYLVAPAVEAYIREHRLYTA
jgi:nicotinate-nucleotide adenylyltransferase